MKHVAILSFALAMSLPCLGQTGIKVVHPATNPEGKILTMEEVIVGRKTPTSAYPSWTSDGYRIYVNGKWETRKIEGFTTDVQKKGTTAQLPQGAASTTPCGTNTAYTIGRSLYYMDANGHSYPIAESENDQITYGQSVSRNEFGIGEGIYWSDSGKKLAFYRKDESLVTDFPLLDITTRTGSLKNIKYPMNGMTSENVRLGVYDLGSASTVWMDVEEFGYDQYLTNISWSPDDKYVFIQVVDRTQEHVKLNKYDSRTGDFVQTILTEDNDRFVEPQDKIWFIKGRNDAFLYRTDNRDGYRNLYLCDTTGVVRRLTCTDADVDYLANDGKYVYYTSAEVSPVENHLFRIALDIPAKGKGSAAARAKFGKAERLTSEEGWHNISLDPSCKYFFDTWSSINVPNITQLRSVDGKVCETIHTSADPLAEYAQCEVDFGTVKSADGQFDNWYRLFKPLNFDPSKKYPVIVYVYGGPHSQMVQDKWLGGIRMWEMYMAQKGYIVYVQDNRGTSNRGAEFEKAIHRQCGQAEMADQMEGIKMLKSLPYVDADRIGVHGWSYGGFMTISLITNYPETFKVGVAGGPVIDWKWYEVMYGERYMDTPETNPEGFERTSLINKAKDLKGKLLICQGAIDNTVVWEHSLSFIRECIKNNVQVDYFPYPCAEHNVGGRDRIHLMDKVTMYFEDYL